MRIKNDALKLQFDAFKGSEIKATSHIIGGKGPSDNEADTERYDATWDRHTNSPDFEITPD